MSAEQNAHGLVVDSKGGFFRKQFVAKTAVSEYADTIYIELAGERGPEYLLAMKADPAYSATRRQKSSGAILAPSSVRGVAPAFVTFVRCDLRFE